MDDIKHIQRIGLPVDITNQKFGKLEAIEFIPGYFDEQTKKRVFGRWGCLCACGEYVEARYSDLKSGKITACDKCSGHKLRRRQPIRDLTGMKFGKWTVQYVFDDDSGSQLHRKCHCVCECGRERDVYYYNLINGHSSGCGYCYTPGYKEDLTGLHVGELIVVGFDSDTKTWNCECSCGNKCKKSTISLKYNKGLLYCGIKSNHKSIFENKEVEVREDLTGLAFGDLIVEHRIEDKVNDAGRHYPMWHCRCSCGGTRDVWGFQLRNGEVTTCTKSQHLYNLKMIEIEEKRKKYIGAQNYMSNGVFVKIVDVLDLDHIIVESETGERWTSTFAKFFAGKIQCKNVCTSNIDNGLAKIAIDNNDVCIDDTKPYIVVHDVKMNVASNTYHKNMIRPVRCVETGVLYANAYEAARCLNWTERPTIQDCCKNQLKMAAGCHWEQYEIKYTEE